MLGATTADDLRQVIERPAALVGLRLEPGLADVLLEDLRATDPSGPGHGTLPLLSHALLATW